MLSAPDDCALATRARRSYGLSYTTWQYSALKAPAKISACANLSAAVTVANTGQMRASETVQLYVRWVGATVPTAVLQLVAFEKILLAPGAQATVTLRAPPRQLALLHNGTPVPGNGKRNVFSARWAGVHAAQLPHTATQGSVCLGKRRKPS